MKKGDFRFKKGFTIIEVSLVLAIAGLIFLMVFVALPSLQRGQRDARRREDIMTYLEELKNYQKNNRGYLPSNTTEWNNFLSKYMGSGFVDPSGGVYQQRVITCNASSADSECTNSELTGTGSVYNSSFPYSNYTLLIVTHATCNGDRVIRTSAPRNVAVLYRMEGAGVYCNNS